MAKIEISGVIIPVDDKPIYDFFGMRSTTPQEVKAVLEKAAGEPVDVEINSPGGNLAEGVEIYTALRAYGNVHICVFSYAGSAASVIAMAGDSEISPAARLMIHNVSTRQQGDHRAMTHASELLRTADRSIAAAYMDKTGLPESEILDMMSRETEFTAAEAVEKGFINRVMFQNDDQLPPSLVASAGGLLPPAVIDRVRELLNQGKETDLKKARAELEFLNLKGRTA